MQRLIDPKTIALQFNDHINNREMEGLTFLMTEDHVFIDSENNRVEGKAANTDNWGDFFTMFSFYRNIFETVISKDNRVIMKGYSLCSNEVLNNVRAIWTAEVYSNKLKEWRIYSDTESNRQILGI